MRSSLRDCLIYRYSPPPNHYAGNWSGTQQIKRVIPPNTESNISV
ncbi:hypothetical protein [Aetokthonos hydrillicola]|jgi:hypothetical protein